MPNWVTDDRLVPSVSGTACAAAVVLLCRKSEQAQVADGEVLIMLGLTGAGARLEFHNS